VGGPTAILEYGGLRWLTDPTLSPPGEYGGLTKLTGPALDVSQQDGIDVLLVSHHQHTDNLDPAGRAFLPSANVVLSTTKAAEALGGNVVGMEPWSEVELETPRGGAVKVTAVHAQHGPDGSDEIQGPVLGFVLSAEGADRIYVSGDNASRDVVRAIVQRTGELPIAILNAGAVQLPKFDRAYLTLSADPPRTVAVPRTPAIGTIGAIPTRRSRARATAPPNTSRAESRSKPPILRQTPYSPISGHVAAPMPTRTTGPDDPTAIRLGSGVVVDMRVSCVNGCRRQ
jgi:L-ascorbate metabolism protein UlaG (beta-lactamase superfamily)